MAFDAVVDVRFQGEPANTRAQVDDVMLHARSEGEGAQVGIIGIDQGRGIASEGILP